MLRPHQIDRIDAGALAIKQPLAERLEILLRQPHQDSERTTVRLDARGVPISAEHAAALERRERGAIAALADAVEDDVKSARHDAREVIALVVDRGGAELQDERRVLRARGTPQFKARQPAEHEQRLTDASGGSVHQRALSSPHVSHAVKELVW